MHGEIIAIGDELISGKVLNTNSNFSARSLFHAGYEIKRITSIGDDVQSIGEVLKPAIKRSNFVIISGGLGPTPDDITNEAVAKALGLRLVENRAIKAKVEQSRSLGYSLSKAQERKLTHLPQGAEVLNPKGKICGYMLEHKGTLLFFLPGVPQEVEEQITNQVLPRLKTLLPSDLVILQKTYKVFGLSETEIDQRLSNITFDEKKVRIGYYPNFPEVFVAITTKEKGKKRAGECFQDITFSVKELLKDFIVAEDDETLEARVGALLMAKGARVTLAESCTGGLISSRITQVPGSSGWFERGLVTYSNQAKHEILGVKEETLRKFGAVSHETCLEMIEGLRQRTPGDYFIAVTGIAGPSGGSPEKPVGTVFIGLGAKTFTRVREYHFTGTRTMIQTLTAETALDLLRRELSGITNKEGKGA